MWDAPPRTLTLNRLGCPATTYATTRASLPLPADLALVDLVPSVRFDRFESPARAGWYGRSEMLQRLEQVVRQRRFEALSGTLLWGVLGAGSGFLILELVGWVVDPLVVAILWRLYRNSPQRWMLLAVYSIGYLAVTAHYLVPDFGAPWPSAADRGYFGFLLAAGAGLLVASLVLARRDTRSRRSVQSTS